MTYSRDWAYQNVLGALRARPSDAARMDTLAGVLIELLGDDAERGVYDLAVALHVLRDEAAFDPTVYAKVHDAIWPDVSESSAFLTFAAEFAGPNMSYAEVEDEALHDLVWSVIERSDEVDDEAAAVHLAFKIMADAEQHNQYEED